VGLYEFREGADDKSPTWHEAGAVLVPGGAKATTVTSTRNRLLVTVEDGTAYLWNLRRDGSPASTKPTRTETPVAGSRRSWQSACLLPNGKVLRLASNWQRGKGGVENMKSEILI